MKNSHSQKSQEFRCGDIGDQVVHLGSSCTMKVIVICASPDTVREILLAAEEIGMIASGEYVFFSIELFTRYVYVDIICIVVRK
ncbi:hypothetical protein NPIL_5101 [Nephila pilipes]|uniref:Uncharacterized protein n=1 Tax=Nephila pilipes TaxID=299642 RepID=A0A8X6PFP3_NEPPI|nr:hypothetical protein NPIL_5101 [Nephila pilipes]